MPHVIIEHSESVAESIHKHELLKKVHVAVVGTDIYDANAVKSRMICHNETAWGADAKSVDFVHVMVRILAGRTIEQRKQTSQAVFDVLKAHFSDAVRLSVDIHEMTKETYVKN